MQWLHAPAKPRGSSAGAGGGSSGKGAATSGLTFAQQSFGDESRAGAGAGGDGGDSDGGEGLGAHAWPPSGGAEAVNATTAAEEIRRHLLGTSCDYRQGRWVYDKTYKPAYSGSCSFIRSGFNCQKNGRKDSSYLKYRWRPAGCAMPRFDANLFLPPLKDKIIAFIGDSISRNFQQAVSCMLASSVAVEDWTGHLGPDTVLGLKIPSHNVRILAFMTPFLVRYTNEPWAFDMYGLPQPKARSISGGNGGAQSYVIWTDVLDSAWTVLFRQLDVVVFMSGHWFLQAQGDTDVRALQFVSNNRPVKMNGMDAYKAVINRVKKFLEVEAKFKGIPMWMTYTPSHYHTTTKPPSCPDTRPAGSSALSLDRAAPQFSSVEVALLQNSRFSILDLTTMSGYRPDGHVQSYYGPVKNSKTKWDCLHWCLPGVPDTWGDVLQLVLRARLGAK
eukprot:TRINITY_DN13031_c1_g3_i1.p1 TRINITY_DN13031_c1_g3~~TRINITY_DN13031_c1_g3_i1.p1  ORF type:complete len:444 (-),score=-11.61 TRINITY_DN13031_c1_g3_i1:37-1368(-)